MSYYYHDRIRKFLMDALRSEPHRNDLYAPNFDDIIACDKAIWHTLGEKVADYGEGLVWDQTHHMMPLDYWVEDVLDMPKISQMIAPRLGGVSKGTKRIAPDKGTGNTGTPGPNHARNVAKRKKGKQAKAAEKAEQSLKARRDGAPPSCTAFHVA